MLRGWPVCGQTVQPALAFPSHTSPLLCHDSPVPGVTQTNQQGHACVLDSFAPPRSPPPTGSEHSLEPRAKTSHRLPSASIPTAERSPLPGLPMGSENTAFVWKTQKEDKVPLIKREAPVSFETAHRSGGGSHAPREAVKWVPVSIEANVPPPAVVWGGSQRS